MISFSCSFFFLAQVSFFLPSTASISDYNTLVFKNCTSTTQPISNPLHESHSQTLAYLFQQLVGESSQSKFFKTFESAGENDNSPAISALFQCRGDMTKYECHKCVAGLARMSTDFCSQSTAARVQLDGCYTLYETDGIPETDTYEVLHKTCSEPNDPMAKGMKLVMDSAFAKLEIGVASNDGFYSMNYESVQVMGQCQGDMEACECGECVSEAIQVVQEACKCSASGEVYLDKCFVSYIYNPNAIPSSELNPGTRRKNSDTLRSAAIIAGGVVALCFVLIFFFFLKSRCKKEDS